MAIELPVIGTDHARRAHRDDRQTEGDAHAKHDPDPRAHAGTPGATAGLIVSDRIPSAGATTIRNGGDFELAARGEALGAPFPTLFNPTPSLLLPAPVCAPSTGMRTDTPDREAVGFFRAMVIALPIGAVVWASAIATVLLLR